MKMVNVLTLDVMVKSSDTSMATVLSRDSNDFLFIVVLVNVGLCNVLCEQVCWLVSPQVVCECKFNKKKSFGQEFWQY